jgi:hypothetical protein
MDLISAFIGGGGGGQPKVRPVTPTSGPGQSEESTA